MAALQSYLYLLPCCMAALLLQLPAVLALYGAASSLSSLHHSMLFPKDHLILPNTIPLLGLYVTLLLSTPAGLEPVFLPLEGKSVLCLVMTILCPFAISPVISARLRWLLLFCVSDNVPLAQAPWGSLPSAYHLICRLPSQNPFLHVHVQNPNDCLQQPYSSQTLCLRIRCHFSDFSGYLLKTVVFPVAAVPAQ